ncbi:mitochondrial ribosomal protein L37-domain-containing protein [Kockovaella imperatae]|uniref:Large ribosomal subunit protein mL54 n=1 Tax=Kockovaella imperatae TaxID=4999 RepID=A0A1Y1U7D3_9TREE|nr:mitochondrial ribosomal protein L37-domain-containing protein [Kockovaella imperatae]ORX33918.1 mitochondrial ribosomal protein L37-domain-containing protein [Kockovaella imperatae]
MSLASIVLRRPYLLRPTYSLIPSQHAAFSTSLINETASRPSPSGTVLSVRKNVISTCEAGRTFPKLALYKDQPAPVAMKDEEYPDWLWTILDEGKAAEVMMGPRDTPVPGEPMDYNYEKKRLRQLNRSNIKAKNFLKRTG